MSGSDQFGGNNNNNDFLPNNGFVPGNGFHYIRPQEFHRLTPVGFEVQPQPPMPGYSMHYFAPSGQPGLMPHPNMLPPPLRYQHIPLWQRRPLPRHQNNMPPRSVQNTTKSQQRTQSNNPPELPKYDKRNQNAPWPPVPKPREEDITRFEYSPRDDDDVVLEHPPGFFDFLDEDDAKWCID